MWVSGSPCARAPSRNKVMLQRRLSIHLITLSHVRDGLDHPTITIFGRNLDMAVPATRYSFRRVKAQQVASRDPVKYAPNLCAGVGVQINR